MKKIKIIVIAGIVLIACAIVAIVLIGKNGIKINKTFSAVVWNTDDNSGTYSAVTVKVNMTYRNNKYSGAILVYSNENGDILYEYNNLTFFANSHRNMELIEYSSQSNTASFIMFDEKFSNIAIFPLIEAEEYQDDSGLYAKWSTKNMTVITAPANTLKEAIKVMDSHFSKSRPSWGDGVLKYDRITPEDIIVN